MRREWLFGVAAALLLMAGGVIAWKRSGAPPVVVLAEPPPASPPPSSAVPTPTAPVDAPVHPTPPAEDSTPAEPRSPVDLVDLQRRLPGNLYWELGVTTTDPEVLARRAAEEQRWSTAHGKVLAGEASDEELHAYFERQRRLHQDYLDFSTQVLNQYGDQLSERDRGLFELGQRMHTDRLAELPKLEAEAVARKDVQDRRRADWEAKGKPVPAP